MTTTSTADTPRAPLSGTETAQITCEGLVRIYKRKGVEVVALQGLDLHVQQGELIAIVGASGSGKSTLLNILAGLDSPSAGRALVAGHDLLAMGRGERRHYRLRTCGFVWQRASANLVPYLTVGQNVELPQRLAGSTRGERAARAEVLLDQLGIADTAAQRPGELTGSQQQRLAVAVALANEPQVLFCDEPTGDLDTAESHEVYGALQQVNETHGTTVVVVTHDPAVAGEVRRTVAIRDGRTASETLRGAAGDTVPQEYAVLDRVGRLQLPRDFVTALGLRHRVRVELVDDHIQIWPEEPPS
ncbi:MAG: ABC transporter ATP-binding protein [Nocardioides sp.]